MTVTLAELSGIYSHEHDCLDRLDKVLRSEREALRSRQLKEINTNSDKKQALINELEMLDQRRRDLIAQMTATDSSKTLSDDIMSRDNLLKKRLQDFQHSNRINLGIIELSRILTDQMLNILRGEQNNDDLYDPGGTHNKSGFTKSIAKV